MRKYMGKFCQYFDFFKMAEALCESKQDKNDEEIQLAQRFGQFDKIEALAEFTHVFTHFKLCITPKLVCISHRTNMIAEARYTWFDMSKLALAPLPAPIKSLLLSLVERN